MNKISIREVITSSFIIFALFVGAGNIIFPPIVGFRYYNNIFPSAIGFIITAVGLPIFSIISLAYSGGDLDSLSKPIGKFFGTTLGVVCHLIVGPLFAVPRTSNISFAVGLSSILEEDKLNFFLYSLFYFSFVIFVSLYPKRLFSTIGKILAPIKVFFLLILGIAVLLQSTKLIKNYSVCNNCIDFAFADGFINGYLTMDTFGAIAFGNIVINSIKPYKKNCYVFKHIFLSCLIASIGLIVVYLILFKLGSDTKILLPEAGSGIEILKKYIHVHFDKLGDIFLSILMITTCIVTAIGLICSCAEFFKRITHIKYKKLVLFFGLFSMSISNIGLNYLIKFSMPILTIIYPPCIVLIFIHFIMKWWYDKNILVIPSISISFIFGCLDAISLISSSKNTLNLLSYLPFSRSKLSWLIPTITTIFLSIIFDRIKKSVQMKSNK